MKRLLVPAGIFIAGLALCQCLFFLQVYASNLDLQAGLRGLEAAGYLVIPGDGIQAGLSDAAPAFFGALFFTFTTGAGLTLLAFLAGWARRRVFPRTTIYPVFVLVFWIALVAAANLNGFTPPATFAFVVIPPAIYTLSTWWLPGTPKSAGGWAIAMHVLVITAAALAWAPRLDRDVFLDARDFLLLSHPVGKAINDFYYQYTLYPAQVLKPLHQKTLKPCRVQLQDQETIDQIVPALLKWDYLPVSAEAPHELTVLATDDHIGFAVGNTLVLEAGLAAFQSGPGSLLSRVSQKADRNGFFRKFTLAGLAAGFPLGLYLLVHAGGCMIMFFIARPAVRSAAASLLCLGLALLCLPAIGPAAGGIKDADQIRAGLESDSWRERRNALKTVAQAGWNPLRNGGKDTLTKSPHVPVRYWMARALAGARQPEARDLLVEMINDEHPNVACAAYYSLGRVGAESEKDLILDRINRIHNWYVQKYAYNALRQLGWKQSLSFIPADR